jgi:hypothetical protein
MKFVPLESIPMFCIELNTIRNIEKAVVWKSWKSFLSRSANICSFCYLYRFVTSMSATRDFLCNCCIWYGVGGLSRVIIKTSVVWFSYGFFFFVCLQTRTKWAQRNWQLTISKFVQFAHLLWHGCLNSTLDNRSVRVVTTPSNKIRCTAE